MIAFFPIGHEESQLRSIPFATIGIILICAVVYAATQNRIEREHNRYAAAMRAMDQLKASVFLHLNKKQGGDMITALIPEDASNYRDVMTSFGERVDAAWQIFIQGKNVAPDDPYYLRYLALEQRINEIKQGSLLWQYGLIPTRLSLRTMLTSMFLHGSLGHLLMNMIFLYLAAFALEDVWGRIAFVLFYLAAGMAASGAHIAMNPGSSIPCIGASGAIAGLMGAFLIRFYKVKIHFAYYYVLLHIYYGRFSVPSYVVLPAWLAMQLLVISLMGGQSTDVAYWAHIGGFGFGVIGAFALSAAGFGKKSLGEKDAEQLRRLKEKATSGPLPSGAAPTPKGIQHNDAVGYEQPLTLPVRFENFKSLLTSQNVQALRSEGQSLIQDYLEADNLPTACQVYEAAVPAAPDLELDDRHLMRLAAFCEQKWENEKALRLLEQVAERKGPAAAKAMLAQARIQAERLRDPQAARETYDRLLDWLPDDPAATLARRQRDRLTPKNS